ncbi:MULTISPECIES: type II toxin-antitoxin system Phd/YefM family antitoxin [Streptomyces]|uniref:type II toxin-antitoxin system Phd/YefM family antitoxin n=1 Tax=Streptomyces TaxID=1883 RepID=UPI00345C2D85
MEENAAEYLRDHMADVLNAALHQGVHRRITRHGSAVAYVVPPAWHKAALEAMEGAPVIAEVPTRTARITVSALLDAAQWDGEHRVITRRGQAAAVLVPPAWHEAAAKKLAAES